MTCTYRRKRIPEVHADAARALDDEYYAIEQVADCLQAQADALQASLDALQAEVDALELVDASLQAQIDDLQAQIDALTSTIEGLPYLTEVKEDLSPDLGGPLRSWGFPIVLSSDIDAQQGILEALDGGGIGLATTDINGFWDTSDAGIGLVDGEVQITGTTTKVDNLQSDGPREVWATQDGILYTVSPPVPGWEVTDSDTGTYAVGLTWTAITGLVINTYAEIAAGSRYDASARIRVSNTGSESGIIRFAFGLDGNPPTVTGESVDVAADFVGLIPISGWSLAENNIPAGTPVMLWVMEAAGNPPQFTPEITGDVAEPHVFVVSVPAGAGATGATNLSVINITATGLTVASDTGSDAILPAATNTAAGIATAAQVAAIDGAVPNTRTLATTGGLQGGGDLTADRTLSPVYGTLVDTVCVGNDARLSDARTPLAHNHLEVNITDLDRLRFKSYWNSTLTYAKNDVVIDGQYIAIAKASTIDKPAPVFTQASPGWLFTDDSGVWSESTGPAWFGHRYGPLIGDTLAQGVRFRTLTASVIQYAYLIVNGAGRYDVAKNLATPANAWVEVRFPPLVLRTNDVIDLVLYVDGSHTYAWGPKEWPSGGNVKSFEYAAPNYPPTSFWVIQFGADVLIQSGTMSANWAILCKSAT